MLPAVEAYRQETHGDTLRYNDILEVVTAANAAIDALEAENERLSAERDRYKEEADRRTREVEGTYRVQMKLRAESLAKERCGNCRHFSSLLAVGSVRTWNACATDSEHRQTFGRSDRCHFIDAENPHGRWELCE